MEDQFDTSQIDGTWNYSDLPGNIVLGEGCYLERRATFERFKSRQTPGLTIGARSEIFMWTVFNVEPDGVVVVGRESVLVGAVIMCAERVEIGERCVISYGVTIADSDFHPRDPAQRRQDAIANAPGGDRGDRPVLFTRPVKIGDDVHIGIGAIILKGAVLESGSRIGAGAVVTGRVREGATVVGNPAREQVGSE